MEKPLNAVRKLSMNRPEKNNTSLIVSGGKKFLNEHFSTRSSTIKETDNSFIKKIKNKRKNMSYKIITGRDIALMIHSEFENPVTYLKTDKELTITSNKGYSGPRFDYKNKRM